MTDLDKLLLCRSALETIGCLLDDPSPERLERCQRLAADALTKTQVSVLPDLSRLFPHINATDHRQKP